MMATKQNKKVLPMQVGYMGNGSLKKQRSWDYL